LDAFHDNRAALDGATAYTPPEGGYVVSEMVAALTICRNYLSEEAREIRGELSTITYSEEDYEFYKNNEWRIYAVLEPVHAALDGANAHSPPGDRSNAVSEMRAPLEICRDYLNEQSRNARHLEDYCGDATARKVHRWKTARIDAVLEPVRAALDGAVVKTSPGDRSDVVSEMRAALTICRGYLDEQSRQAWDEVNIATCEEQYEFRKRNADRIHAVLEPVCAALGGANAYTPHVVSEISAALKICRNYLNEEARETSQEWNSARIDAVLKPVCCALDLERAGAAPERETGLAAAGKKDKTMTTRAKDQTELDAFHDNRAALRRPRAGPASCRRGQRGLSMMFENRVAPPWRGRTPVRSGGRASRRTRTNKSDTY